MNFFTGLPVPMTTRSKVKQAEKSISTIENTDSLEDQFLFGHPTKKYVQFHD